MKNSVLVGSGWLLAMLFNLSGLFAQNRQPPIAASKLVDIMIESDPMVLKSNDEQRAEQFLKEKNSRMIDYLIQRYPQYGRPDVDLNDPAATWFGLVCAMYEAVGFQPLNSFDFKTKALHMDQIPAWLSCAMGVLGTTLAVPELISSLGTFSFGTVWTVVKFVVKKYVTGWLATGIALFNITTNCF